LSANRPIPVRNPDAVRPWQHVLEPLAGYLLLGARLAEGVAQGNAAPFCGPWNFGPRMEDSRSVRQMTEELISAWGQGTWEDRHDPKAPHEAGLLHLSIDKAQTHLGWSPRWRF